MRSVIGYLSDVLPSIEHGTKPVVPMYRVLSKFHVKRRFKLFFKMCSNSERKFDPGAARYGNFINYYQFNPPDERIKYLPSNVLHEISKLNHSSNLYCLDIGCNSGDLTKAIYSHLISNNTSNLDIRMLGVDLDHTLIDRAKENPVMNIDFRALDIMDPKDYPEIVKFLPSGVKFDISFAFSVTMWIHLNHGDEGLKRFLSQLTEISQFILLEPQPWKCYLSAARRMRKLKCTELTNLDHLAIKNNVVEFIINFLTKDCSMDLFYESNCTKWGRKLFLFSRSVNYTTSKN